MATFIAIKNTKQTRGAMAGAMGYVAQDEKTQWRGISLVAGCNCVPQSSYIEFLTTKKRFHKMEGRQFYHLVQSFAEGDRLSPQMANAIGVELAEQEFPDFEVLVATHIDTGHLHNHLIVNSVSCVDGRKLHQNTADLQHHRDMNDQICLAHGLSVLPKSRKHSRKKRMEPGEYGHMEGDNTPIGYCQIALENGKKMLEVSPSLSLCSSGPYPNKEWVELSAKPLGGISQMISQHYYGYAPHYTDISTVEEEYNRCLASASRMRDLIHQSRQWLEPSMRISMDEWNVWYAWYRPSSVTDGIYAALVLHMLMEEAEKSGIAIACHFQAVNEGMLCVKPDHVSLTAQGQVFSWMNRWHMGNRLCSASQEAVVSVDREGRMAVTVVNAAFRREKPVDFSSFGPCSEAVLFSSDNVLPPSSFTQADILGEVAAGTFQMPPHSVLFLRFPSGN